MDFSEIVSTNGTCRYFRRDAVTDALLGRVMSAARWAPSGGNRQPVSLIAVRDTALKTELQTLYVPIWDEYLQGIRAGKNRVGGRRRLVEDADYFARHIAEIPVLVVVCARLADVHPTDSELGRLSIVGGASVYPGVQNMLLAARDAGLGTALTTLLCAVEPQVKVLLDIPADVSTAAMVAMGWPERPFPKKLKRLPLEEIAYIDRFGAKFSA